MADKSISELVAATAVGSTDLFVLEQTGTAKKLTGQILENWLVSFADGHGGIQSLVKTSSTGTNPVIDTYTITYADESTSTFTVTNGIKGDKGDQTYFWIKYAAQYPTADSQIGDSPDDWIGVYTGTATTAPTTRGSYTWFQWKGETGDPATLTSAAITYQASTSGTVIPSGTWQSEIPYVAQGNYLWTRVVLNFNSGDPVTYYSAARTGIDGHGAPATAVPLADNTSGAVGTSYNFAREDHRHPLPVANDIKLENGTSVQVAIDYLPTWRGKRALIIGDSWLAGWNGETNITPWSSKFISLTGIVPDRVVLSGGGFTLNGTGTYTSESFVSCLDQVKDNKYDLIIVQGGVNDIVTGTASISDAIESFRTKCDTYFPNVPVYYIPTTPFYMLGSDQNKRALSLMRYAIENGLITAKESAMFSFFRTTYKGEDLYHPSQTGMDRLGTYIASFINCGVFPKEFTQISAWSSYASYVKDVSFNSNVTNGTQYTRLYGEIVNVSASFTGASSQSGGWLTVMSGLPIPCIDYQSGLAFINGSGGTTTIPVYVNNGELILDLGTSNNINGKSVDVRMTYTTKSV